MSGCVLASGEVVGGGYIRKWRGGARKLAHVLAYEDAHGPVPDGYEVGHMCHDDALAAGTCAGGDGCVHRSCVNLEHLAIQTKSENMKAAKGYRGGVCHRGHDLSVKGVYESSSECVQCVLDRVAANKRRKKG